MKKALLILLSLATVLTSVPFFYPVRAADAVVYVSELSGNDNNSGTTASAPLKTLEAAIRAVQNGGRIVLIGDVSLTGSDSSQYVEPEHTGKITISSENNAQLKLQSAMVYALSGPTEFENLTINTGSGNTVIAARFNDLVFGEGLEMTGSNLVVVGGYQTPTGTTPVGKDSNITIKSGKYNFIVGFSRSKGTKTLTYTGISHITVYGGTIATIYGASTINHYSGSTDIKIYGGKVKMIYTGGDMTRRLNGTSNIELCGGEVTKLEINNAIGDTTIKLDGGKLSVLAESIYQNNADITKLASTATRSLSYNSLIYTKNEIEKLGEGIIDRLSSFGDAYLKSGATGDGKSASDPTGNLSAALSLVGESGGTIRVIGSYTVTGAFSEPSHSGKVTIKGSEEGGRLVFASGASYTLSGPTVFSLPTENADIQGSVYSLTFDENYTSDGKTVVHGADVHIAGGAFSAVYAAQSNSTLELSGGSIEKVVAAENGKTDASVTLSLHGAEVTHADLTGVNGSLTVSCQAGSLGTIKAGYTGALNDGATYSLTYGSGFDASLFAEILPLFSLSDEKVLYVRDNGTGNGFSPSTATTLQAAFEALKDSGGTVVICGETTVKTVTLSAAGGPVLLTSLYGGTDYRTEGAKIILGGNITFRNEIALENLTIRQDMSAPKLIFSGNNATLGGGITVEKPEAYTDYPTMVGGKDGQLSNAEYTLTIKSGDYGYIYLGSSASSASLSEITATLVIDGGTFYRQVYAAGSSSFSGDTTVKVNGGTLRAGLYGVGILSDILFNGTMTFDLNGGAIIGKIAPAFSKLTSLKGEFTVNLNGGSFVGVTDILGSNAFKGKMTSRINIASSVDIFAKETGEHSYTNPIVTAADPWVIYKDGYYYFTRTAGSSIGVAKATNLGDLANAPLVTVFKPADGKEYSKNLWSPELHYYTAADFPNGDFKESDEGWYILLACDNGDNANHRMFVIKSLDGDPQGQYGNPVTLEANVPQKILSDTDPSVGQVWACGQTDGVINGELYCFWVSEKFQEEPIRRYQTLNISKMKNPWTLTGKCSVICEPTMPWEKHGATYSIGSNGKIYPEVVEGIATVSGPNGELFMLYCGSGYWTEYYCLGQLKLVGSDPTDYDSWYKYPEPVLTKSSDFNGTGHCCYTVSPEGKTNIIIYHAYLGAKKAGSRYMVAETYTVSSDGITIGNGSRQTAPASTVFTIEVNPMPLVKKIAGFDEGIDPFVSISDLAVSVGSSITVTPTLSSGDTYKAEQYGELRFEYKVNGTIGAFQKGLPPTDTDCEYLVKAVLEGVNSYSGLGTSFIIKVGSPSSSEDTTVPTVTTDTTTAPDEGSITPLLLGAGIGAVLLAVAAILVVKFKKKKSN